MADETIKLALDMGPSAANVDKVNDKLGELDAAAKKAAGAADEMGKSAGLSGNAMLQLGRGVQDFQAAGLNGIVNNFEGLALALGLGSGVAGVATLAAVAVQAFLPKLKEMVGSLGGGDKAAEGMASAMEKMSEAADKLKTKLAELNAEQSTRVRQMREENQELERQVKLSEQRAANRERPAREQTEREVKAAAMEGAPSLEEQRQKQGRNARSEEIKKLVGGDPEAAIIKQRVALSVQNTPGFHARSQQARDAERDRILGRFYAGDPKALQHVINALRPPGGDEFGQQQVAGEGPLRAGLEELTPANQRARMGRNIGQTLEGFGRRVRGKAAAEAAKDKARRDKEVAGLEQQYAGDADDLAAAQRRDDAKAIQDQVRLGRQVGKAAAGRKPPALGHVPMLGENPSDIELDNAALHRAQQHADDLAAFEGMPAPRRRPGGGRRRRPRLADGPRAPLGAPRLRGPSLPGGGGEDQAATHEQGHQRNDNVQRAIVANQAAMTANLDGMQQLLEQARQVGKRNDRIARQRQQSAANSGVL